MIWLRCFSQQDADKIAYYVVHPDYATFFRNNAIIPTREDCANYPAWSQNIVMMAEYNDGTGWKTIGMVVGYHVNYRNKTVKAGILIEKDYQGKKLGHDIQSTWIDFLFKRLGFRKVIVENVEEHFTEPYKKVGFFEEGIHRLECQVNGEYVNEIRMACFEEDWVCKIDGKVI